MANWTKLTSDSAVDLATQAGLEGPARELLAPDMRPETYLERLEEKELWTEAIAVTARALPIREGIGWGCLCDRSVPDEEEDPRHEALLRAAERFVYEPTDEHRRAALELAQSEPDQSAGQMLAMAAGLSGGSVRVGENPPVPIPLEAVSPMIGGAVLITATRVEPEEVADTYRRFLRRAKDIGEGGTGRLPDDPAPEGEG